MNKSKNKKAIVLHIHCFCLHLLFKSCIKIGNFLVIGSVCVMLWRFDNELWGKIFNLLKYILLSCLFVGKYRLFQKRSNITLKKKPQVGTTLKSSEPKTNDGAWKCFPSRHIISSFKNDALYVWQGICTFTGYII